MNQNLVSQCMRDHRKSAQYFINNHVNDALYDNHKSDADTYRGYWSFETAAIAISLGMSDDDFRGVEYYPAF